MARRTKKIRKKIEEAEIPMSSMIDVVFLLLIYFIVTQKPLIDDTLLGVDLPSDGGAVTKSKTPQLFVVDVMKLPRRSSEIYHINNKAMMFKDIQNTLMEVAAQDPDTTVIINCGPNARHQKLIKLLDACAEAGLNKLNIVNDESIVYRPDIIKRD